MTGQFLSPTWVVLVVVVAWSAYWLTSSNKQKQNLPPGPQPVPLFGNLFQIPKQFAWRTYIEWTRQYGPIVYLNLAGKPAVLLGSQKVVYDLLEKRSAIYSERPQVKIAELLTKNKHLLFMPPDNLWKRGRRAAHQLLSPQAICDYEPVQLSEALEATKKLLQQPENWVSPLQEGVGLSTFRVIYGNPKGTGIDDVHHINAFSDHLAKNMAPGKHLADVIPALDYLPKFLAPWKTWAPKRFEEDNKYFIKLIEDVKSRMTHGQSRICIASEYFNSYAEGSNGSDDAWIMSSMFAGASETTVLILVWFVKAMIRYPHVQQKAQQELDANIGRERAPELADLKHLTYMRAMVRELLRWTPFMDTGIPHLSTEDDVYEGYFIPKGTIIFANVMCLNRDKDVYGEDAHEFNPARFLSDDGQLKEALPNTRDEGHVTFGFGRRHCFGRHLASQSLMSFMTSLLWAFEIRPGMHEEGLPAPDDLDDINHTGALHWPNPFELKFKLRCRNTESLLDLGIQRAEST